MAQSIKAVRGMHDALPVDTPRWQFMESTVRRVLHQYGYEEIRFPLVEHTDLFERSIGSTSDIVTKEMYTFEDRSGETLTLRPEGTAGCVRAGIEHGLFGTGPCRLWYGGPMFRRERPQKGRYRQFHQVGAEAFGFDCPDVDAELICVGARIWRALGIEDVSLQINTLGNADERARYRDVLVRYFKQHDAVLDDESRLRLTHNPLRILDSKNPALHSLISAAPSIDESLDSTSRAQFELLRDMLDAASVPYTHNPRLVRGIDYYNGPVFEWVTDRLGAQGAICAGGRYDGLVEHFGGKPTPAAGFAIGLERVLELIGPEEPQRRHTAPHAYLIAAGDGLQAASLKLAEQLRTALPGLRLVANCGSGSVKSQFKRANRSGADLAIVLGEAELESGTVGVKPLRGDGGQFDVPIPDLARELAGRLSL